MTPAAKANVWASCTRSPRELDEADLVSKHFLFLGVSALDSSAQMQRGRLVSRGGLRATPMCNEAAAYAEQPSPSSAYAPLCRNGFWKLTSVFIELFSDVWLPGFVSNKS